MKIGQQPELPSTLAQTGSARQAKNTPSAAEGAVKGAMTAPAAGVPVTVSSAARALEQTGRSQGDFDAGKVKSVRAAIDKGTFSVNADAIADKLLSNAQEMLGRPGGN